MNSIISQLQWRYATKQFDKSQKLTPEQVSVLKQAIVLTPSSMGLQPYEIAVVQDQKIKEQLFPHAFNQAQVTTASHLFIFCAQKSYTKDQADRFLQDVASTRNQTLEQLSGLSSMIHGFVDGYADENKFQWAARQAYIAMGNLLVQCAYLQIDACPMEGFNPQSFAEVLKLDTEKIMPVAMVAVGYRSSDDKYSNMKKVRNSDIFIEY